MLRIWRGCKLSDVSQRGLSKLKIGLIEIAVTVNCSLLLLNDALLGLNNLCLPAFTQ
jgi:hypothetical protein